MDIKDLLICILIALGVFGGQVACLYLFRKEKIERWEKAQQEERGPQREGYYFFKKVIEGAILLLPLYFSAFFIGWSIGSEVARHIAQ